MELHGVRKPPKTGPRGRFRSACTVMLDTIVNRTYDLRIERVEKAAKEVENQYPSLAKTMPYVARYAFWVPIALFSNWMAGKLVQSRNEIIHHVGPIALFSIASAHIYAVSVFARNIPEVVKKAWKCLRHRGKAEEPKASELKPSKPTSAIYIGSFALVDPAFIVTYASVTTAIAGLSNGVVKPAMAACAVVVGIISGLIVDCALFGLFWAKKVLRNAPQGNIRDELRGFLRGIASEFRPILVVVDMAHTIADNVRKLLRISKQTTAPRPHHPNPAKSAGEYAGQLWGVMESHFIWLQGLRMVFAIITTTVASVQPALFMTALWANSAMWGYDIIGGFMLAKYYGAIERKIEENNKRMGLG